MITPISMQTAVKTADPAKKAPILQRKCACGQHTPGGGECAGCREKARKLQRSALGSTDTQVAPPIVNDVLRSSGHPLDRQTRSFMEPRFGFDFGRVRIHTSPRAAESARAISALAYTVGSDVVFAQGEYSTATQRGRRLLAHELAHVVQQSSSTPTGNDAVPIGPVDSAFEAQAEIVARSIDHKQPGKDEELGEGTVPTAVVASPSLMRTMSAVLQRDVSNKCFAPSVLYSTAGAIGFGIIAEKFIELDYDATSGVSPADRYFDDSFAGPIDPDYVDFIIRKNPGLSLKQRLILEALSVDRPDIMAHTPALQEFYEIKPDSISGRFAGRVKLASIATYLKKFKLKYARGTSFTPTPSIPMLSTTIVGLPVNVSLEVHRDADGLLVYNLCIETDWTKVTIAILTAILVAIIIVLSRGRFPAPEPGGIPNPGGLPTFAENGGAGTDDGGTRSDADSTGIADADAGASSGGETGALAASDTGTDSEVDA